MVKILSPGVYLEGSRNKHCPPHTRSSYKLLFQMTYQLQILGIPMSVYLSLIWPTPCFSINKQVQLSCLTHTDSQALISECHNLDIRVPFPDVTSCDSFLTHSSQTYTHSGSCKHHCVLEPSPVFHSRHFIPMSKDGTAMSSPVHHPTPALVLNNGKCIPSAASL